MDNLILITSNEDYDKRQKEYLELSKRPNKSTNESTLLLLLDAALSQYEDWYLS